MKSGFWMAETTHFLLLGAVSTFAALLQGWPPVILGVTVLISGIPLILQEYENGDDPDN
jgi:hypothetical protein